MPVLDVDTGKLLDYHQLRIHPKLSNIWNESYSKELGRLFQGIGKLTNGANQLVKGTNTFHLINDENIPINRHKEITYTKVVCLVRSQKAGTNRTQITIGGSRICYPGDVGTNTDSLEPIKLILNSVLSCPGATFSCFDIYNFYLKTPINLPEYFQVKLADIPQDFIDKYNLTKHARDGWVYFDIRKGVYGLPQYGKLANDLLRMILERHG